MHPSLKARSAFVIAFGAAAVAVALGQVGRGTDAEIWDDALFFRRVAYNVLHHGFAGWNQVDGPVFMNTSQAYQAVSTVLFALAPNHFNAMAVLWAAACTSVTFVLLSARDLAENALLFVALQAPPIFLAIATGMDTCTVFVVVAAFLWVARRASPRPAVLAAMNALVYLARPDAVLLSSLVSIAILSAPSEDRARRVLVFCVATGAMLLALSAVFRAYYGTALPLATFLKISPVSIYDRGYIALGLPGKLLNVRQIGLLLAPLAPFIAMRPDRENLGLVAGALVFLGFHAATTNEIMGYHARFYAPAMPVLAYAAARGVSRVNTPRRRWLVMLSALLAAALALLAYERGWIENGTRGSYVERTPLASYVVYFLGLAIVGASLALRERPRTIAALALAVAAPFLTAVATFPQPFTVASDQAIYESTAARDADLVGVDAIRACFAEPFQLAHSELGMPGVLFPESRIIDFTGLANPTVVSHVFDLERLCSDDRPEFVYRPHWTHRQLNAQVTASRCFATEYTAVPLARPSACPLLVRNDLVGRFEACASRTR